MRSILLFVVYVSTSCFGLYLIKAAEDWRTPQFVIGFCMYAAGALLWMIILRLTPLSLAFPVAAGALMLGTTVTGRLFLGEAISPPQLGGAVMILGGIILIAINR